MTEELTVTEKEQQALTWPEKAKAITIVDNASFQLAANMKLDLAALRKAIIADNEAPKKAAAAAHKAACDHESKYLKPVKEAEELLATAIKQWQDKQERQRRIEQARLEAEACEAAERERQQREEEALNAAIAEGTEEVYVEPAVYTPPPVAAKTYEPVKGLGITRRWGAEVTDIKELCRAVADGVVPETYVLPNGPALNARASADKQSLLIPGVKAVQR